MWNYVRRRLYHVQDMSILVRSVAISWHGIAKVWAQLNETKHMRICNLSNMTSIHRFGAQEQLHSINQPGTATCLICYLQAIYYKHVCISWARIRECGPQWWWRDPWTARGTPASTLKTMNFRLRGGHRTWHDMYVRVIIVVKFVRCYWACCSKLVGLRDGLRVLVGSKSSRKPPSATYETHHISTRYI